MFLKIILSQKYLSKNSTSQELYVSQELLKKSHPRQLFIFINGYIASVIYLFLSLLSYGSVLFQFLLLTLHISYYFNISLLSLGLIFLLFISKFSSNFFYFPCLFFIVSSHIVYFVFYFSSSSFSSNTYLLHLSFFAPLQTPSLLPSSISSTSPYDLMLIIL